MAKTSKQVESDIRKLIQDSTLYTMISGEVYRNGLRPRDSQKEDAVVIFSSGLPNQIQTGVVIINLFVPDIDPYGDGVFVEDGKRVERLEQLAQEWVDSLTAEVSCYRFRQQQTIYTDEEADIHQHVIVIRLAYEFFGDDCEAVTVPQQAYIDATDTDNDSCYMPLLETEYGVEVVIQPVMQKKNL